MRIALVQLESVKGETEINIREHLSWVTKAAKASASLVVFPELSITGYDSPMAGELAMAPEDGQLLSVQQAAKDHNISIAVGVPVKTSEKPQISLVVFHPDGNNSSYNKEYLHDDELPYFSAGEKKQKLSIMGERIALAICYEIFVDQHTESVIDNATVFLASVAKSQTGMERAAVKAEAIAARYNVPVLICNSIGQVEDYIAAGGTAVWNQNAEKLASISPNVTGILLWDTTTNRTEIIT